MAETRKMLFRLPPELHDRLAAEAERSGVTKTSIVLAGLSRELDEMSRDGGAGRRATPERPVARGESQPTEESAPSNGSSEEARIWAEARAAADARMESYVAPDKGSAVADERPRYSCRDPLCHFSCFSPKGACPRHPGRLVSHDQKGGS